MKHHSTTPADTVRFAQLVRKLKFFGSMNIVLLEQLLAGLLVFQFERGEKVCAQGEAGDSFFMVQEGRLLVSTKKGRFSLARRVATLGPGDCFGEMALLHEAPRNATVTCSTSSRIFVLPARHFQSVLDQNPAFATEIRDLADCRQFELDHGQD
jgi:CRP-like cAMP-binding protein